MFFWHLIGIILYHIKRTRMREKHLIIYYIHVIRGIPFLMVEINLYFSVQTLTW